MRPASGCASWFLNLSLNGKMVLVFSITQG